MLQILCIDNHTLRNLWTKFHFSPSSQKPLCEISEIDENFHKENIPVLSLFFLNTPNIYCNNPYTYRDIQKVG